MDTLALDAGQHQAEWRWGLKLWSWGWMPPLGLSVNGDRGQGNGNGAWGALGDRGRGGDGAGWSGQPAAKEQTCKPMMRHYSSMLLQGLSRKPGALFIISFFFFFPFYGTTVAPYSSALPPGLWAVRGTEATAAAAADALALSLWDAALSSRFSTCAQGHCTMLHHNEHLKTAKAVGKSHCLSSHFFDVSPLYCTAAVNL